MKTYVRTKTLFTGSRTYYANRYNNDDNDGEGKRTSLFNIFDD